MRVETFSAICGVVSGILVLASAIPYLRLVWQRKNSPHPMSWALWTLIGLSILLTYKSSGAGENMYPAIQGFINPLLVICIMLYHRQQDRKKLAIKSISQVGFITTQLKEMPLTQKLALVLGLTSLALWIVMKDNQNLSKIALYIGIFADACAGFFTVQLVWKDGMEDRPFSWLLFCAGWLIDMGAVTKHDISEYALPAYMVALSAIVGILTLIPRIKNRTPILEWI